MILRKTFAVFLGLAVAAVASRDIQPVGRRLAEVEVAAVGNCGSGEVWCNDLGACVAAYGALDGSACCRNWNCATRSCLNHKCGCPAGTSFCSYANRCLGAGTVSMYGRCCSDAHCVPGAGFTCNTLSHSCKCQTGKTYCYATQLCMARGQAKYGEACCSNAQCASRLACDPDTRTCHCMTGTYYCEATSLCVPAARTAGRGKPCCDDSSCTAGLTCGLGYTCEQAQHRCATGAWCEIAGRCLGTSEIGAGSWGSDCCTSSDCGGGLLCSEMHTCTCAKGEVCTTPSGAKRCLEAGDGMPGSVCCSTSQCAAGLECGGLNYCGCSSGSYCQAAEKCLDPGSGKYGDACCLSNECNQGLMCSGNKCTCSTGTGTWCTAANRCIDTSPNSPIGRVCCTTADCLQGLSCLSNICGCDQGSWCQPAHKCLALGRTRSNGDTCCYDDDCNPGLSCDGTSNTCRCRQDTSWCASLGRCLAVGSGEIGTTCCDACRAGLACTDNTCRCPSGKEWCANLNACIASTGIPNDGDCCSSSQCTSRNCLGNKCRCATNTLECQAANGALGCYVGTCCPRGTSPTALNPSAVCVGTDNGVCRGTGADAATATSCGCDAGSVECQRPNGSRACFYGTCCPVSSTPTALNPAAICDASTGKRCTGVGMVASSPTACNCVGGTDWCANIGRCVASTNLPPGSDCCSSGQCYTGTCTALGKCACYSGMVWCPSANACIYPTGNELNQPCCSNSQCSTGLCSANHLCVCPTGLAYCWMAGSKANAGTCITQTIVNYAGVGSKSDLNSYCCNDYECITGLCNASSGKCACDNGRTFCTTSAKAVPNRLTCILKVTTDYGGSIGDPNSPCCNDADCVTGTCSASTGKCTCSGGAGSTFCPAGAKAHEGTCISKTTYDYGVPTGIKAIKDSLCCNDVDCGGGTTCNLSVDNGKCACLSGASWCTVSAKAVPNRNTCITKVIVPGGQLADLNSPCCNDADCVTGLVCSASTGRCTCAVGSGNEWCPVGPGGFNDGKCIATVLDGTGPGLAFESPCCTSAECVFGWADPGTGVCTLGAGLCACNGGNAKCVGGPHDGATVACGGGDGDNCCGQDVQGTCAPGHICSAVTGRCEAPGLSFGSAIIFAAPGSAADDLNRLHGISSPSTFEDLCGIIMYPSRLKMVFRFKETLATALRRVTTCPNPVGSDPHMPAVLGVYETSSALPPSNDAANAAYTYKICAQNAQTPNGCATTGVFPTVQNKWYYVIVAQRDTGNPLTTFTLSVSADLTP